MSQRMDPRTAHLLNRIGLDSFKRNIKPNMKKVDVYARERVQLEEWKKRGPTKEAREQAARLLDNPLYYRKEEKIDPYAAQKHSDEVGAVIEREIRKGNLEAPDTKWYDKISKQQQSEAVKQKSKELNDPEGIRRDMMAKGLLNENNRN